MATIRAIFLRGLNCEAKGEKGKSFPTNCQTLPSHKFMKSAKLKDDPPKVGFKAGMRCHYCGARTRSMFAARLVLDHGPRLGSIDSAVLECFSCLNDHLHGVCWLVHLSSVGDDDESSDDDVESLTDYSVDQVSSLHNHHMQEE